ncbi:MAG: hypothetical protein AAF542_23165 [Pseudomonadota bacterium]
MSENEIAELKEKAKALDKEILEANPSAATGACWAKAGSSSDCVGVMTKETCYKVWDSPPYEVTSWKEGESCP